ncbi:hypothetical protein FRC19_006937 [Serendipita sp. 401]|nr:hypothetical protein FRC19_006937 [Serendipita sp. 401]KAG8814092.1 hypothetical protein FRC18_002124 [Serendipita sp. 400]
MFKAKSRPKNQRKTEVTETEEEEVKTEQQETRPDGSTPLSLEDIMALRSLRKAKQGIDASKLAMGEPKKRKRPEDGEQEEKVQYGLQRPTLAGDEDDRMEDESAKARRTVRKNNFTQQTNALDVDKHMMAYIEENIKLLKEKAGKSTEESDTPQDAAKTEDEMLKFGDKYKTHGVELKEGSVTNSLAMLSAIPEVDLGMDARLRNIQETEKAKRMAAEEKERMMSGRLDADQARLAATRFYNPHLRQESDEKLLKQAKYEALGLSMPERQRRQNDRQEIASDEAVMERFKKRMKR